MLTEAITKFLEVFTGQQVFDARLPFERKMRRLWARRFKAQGAAVLKELNVGVSRESAVSLQNLLLAILDVPDEDWTGNIASIVGEAIKAAGETTVTDLLPMPSAGFTFDMAQLSVNLYQYSSQLIRGIDEVTRQRVIQILGEGAAEGLSYSQIATNLRREFRQFAVPRPQRHIRDRATLIAVTEIGTAYVKGQVEAVRQMMNLGMRFEKYWQTVGDDRVSDGCLGNQDDGWIDFDELFSSGHSWPLRFPGCRCSLLTRIKG